jgi:hypothetical protein
MVADVEIAATDNAESVTPDVAQSFEALVSIFISK